MLFHIFKFKSSFVLSNLLKSALHWQNVRPRMVFHVIIAQINKSRYICSDSKIFILALFLYWAIRFACRFYDGLLPVILRDQGVSLAHIGGFMLPWSIKIFWAPWVDRTCHLAFRSLS